MLRYRAQQSVLDYCWLCTITDTAVPSYPVTYMYNYISDSCRWHCGMLTNCTQRASVQSAKDPTHNPKLEANAVTVTD